MANVRKKKEISKGTWTKYKKKKKRERAEVYKIGNKEIKIVLEEKEKEDLEK